MMLTEQNTIPQGWKETTLGEVGRVITGKTPPTACLDYYGGNIPFVTPRDMDFRKTIDTTERYLTEDGVDAVKGSYLPAGSIMVSCIGSDMGKVAVAKKDCVTNQQINSIIVDHARYSPDFIYYNLSKRQAEFQNLSGGGSALPILNKGHFALIIITCPPLPEQKAIAALLSSFDDKIELLRRQNKTLESIAQTIFKEWFLNFTVNGKKLKVNSKTGLPEGWKMGKLGDELKIVYGKNLPTENMTKEGFPVFGGNGQIGFYSEFLYEDRQVLISCRGEASGKVNISLPKSFVTNNSLILEIPEGSTVNFCFLKYFSLNTDFTNYVSGSAQPQITIEGIKDCPIVLSTKEILSDAQKMIKPIEDKMLFNFYQIQTLSRLRDALLPKLMKGEIRVKF